MIILQVSLPALPLALVAAACIVMGIVCVAVARRGGKIEGTKEGDDDPNSDQR